MAVPALYALPELVPIATPRDLSLQAIRTESFLMVPVVNDPADQRRAHSGVLELHG